MTVAELFRPASIAPVPARTVAHEGGGAATCAECFRLRGEYIRRLAEFNEAAARHRMVMRAAMEGPAAQKSWRAFQDACSASRAAWARYRRHASSLSAAA